MGSLKGFCTTKAKALDNFLGSVKDRDVTSEDVTILKALRQALKEQFNQMRLKWDYSFEDDDVFTKFKTQQAVWDFKSNSKNFQKDLHRLKEHASGIQNMFCLKS